MRGKKFSWLHISIAAYFAIVLIPLMIIEILFYISMMKKSQIEVTGRAGLNLAASVEAVDSSIDSAEKACISIFNDQRVKKYLKPIAHSTTEDRINQVEIHSLINAMTTVTDALTENLFIYLDDQHVFSDGLYSFQDYFGKIYVFEDYGADFWYGLLDTDRSLFLLPATQLTRRQMTQVERVVPIVYRTTLNGQAVAAVVTVSLDHIAARIHANLSSDSIHLTILDTSNGVVFTDLNATDAMLVAAHADTLPDSLYLSSGTHQLVSAISMSTGWRYFLTIPNEQIYQLSDEFLFLLVITILAFMVATFLSLYFSWRIFDPISHIYAALDAEKNMVSNEPGSLQALRDQVNVFMSNYHEAQAEEQTLRNTYVELAVLNLLSGRVSHLPHLRAMLERDYAFDGDQYQLAVIEVGFHQCPDGTQDTERINLQVNFTDDLTTYLSRQATCLLLEHGSNRYICLFNHHGDEQSVWNTLNHLLQSLQNHHAVKSAKIVLGQPNSLENLSDDYAHIAASLAALPQEEAFHLEYAQCDSSLSLTAYTIKDEMNLYNCLKSGDQDKALSLVREICQRSLSLPQEDLVIHELFITGMRYLADQDETLSDLSRYQSLHVGREIRGGLPEKRRLLEEFYRQLTNDRENIGKDSNLTASIVSYVQKNYASDLNLERIADDLGLSVKYISKVFKTKTGRNLSDYINEVRIGHVKRMLFDTDMSISSISENVGIYSRTTLLRLFRKYEGITPSEYRELMREKKG